MRLFGTIVSYLDAGRILLHGRLDRTDPAAGKLSEVTSFIGDLCYYALLRFHDEHSDQL